MIYTIGYQRLPVAQLDALLDELDATLVDVRAVPFSRNPAYTKASLQGRYGSTYVLAGHFLGGIPRGRTTRQTTPQGIEWLRAREANSVLLCMEHSPVDCHRHQLIAGPHFPDALHVWEGGLYRAGDVTACDGQDIAPVGELGCWQG